jgi:hypothetical protein
MAAISHVFTIARVAHTLGIDEDRLWELSEAMDPEDGRLRVYGPDDESTVAFTPAGIENLQQLIADQTAT